MGTDSEHGEPTRRPQNQRTDGAGNSSGKAPPEPDDITTGIPAAILARHPELSVVDAALDEYRRGAPITARCPQCRAPLVVESMPEALVVSCLNGHTLFHANRTR